MYCYHPSVGPIITSHWKPLNPLVKKYWKTTGLNGNKDLKYLYFSFSGSNFPAVIYAWNIKLKEYNNNIYTKYVASLHEVWRSTEKSGAQVCGFWSVVLLLKVVPRLARFVPWLHFPLLSPLQSIVAALLGQSFCLVQDLCKFWHPFRSILYRTCIRKQFGNAIHNSILVVIQESMLWDWSKKWGWGADLKWGNIIL